MNDKGHEGDIDSNGNADKSDTEDNFNVLKNIKIPPSRIDEKNERERNRETQRVNNIKNLEDREERKIDKGKTKEGKEEERETE
eukprot:15938556-Heterocapsa_arctica.AAC.1